MRYKDRLIPLDTKIIKSIYAVGDIHGNFIPFADDLVNSCKVKNCAVIVCGDIGLGFGSEENVLMQFDKMEEMLSSKNIFAIFFRGNHDDPELFTYKEDNFTNNYPHIIIAEDFSIVEYYQKTKYKLTSYRILLWGGGISVDRKYRSPGISYWKNEPPTRITEEMIKNNGDIDCVCSHSSPSFCMPQCDFSIYSFYAIDPNLKDDIIEERKILSDGAATIYKMNRDTLTLWVYGHYHNMYYNINMNDEMTTSCPGVMFIGLDMFRTDYSVKKLMNYTCRFFNRKHRNHIITICKPNAKNYR